MLKLTPIYKQLLETSHTDVPNILYHATSYDKLGSILTKGLIANNTSDGAVFFTADPKSSAKFMLMRGINYIVVIPVKLSSLDKNKIKESFDHSENFFKTRAWMYMDDIPANKIMKNKIMLYDLR